VQKCGRGLPHARSFVVSCMREHMQPGGSAQGPQRADKRVELFCLLSRSGLDAALAPCVPSTLASTVVGVTPGEVRSGTARLAQPAGSPAA
jgi:hypothetical protein